MIYMLAMFIFKKVSIQAHSTNWFSNKKLGVIFHFNLVLSKVFDNNFIQNFY